MAFCTDGTRAVYLWWDFYWVLNNQLIDKALHLLRRTDTIRPSVNGSNPELGVTNSNCVQFYKCLLPREELGYVPKLSFPSSAVRPTPFLFLSSVISF